MISADYKDQKQEARWEENTIPLLALLLVHSPWPEEETGAAGKRILNTNQGWRLGYNNKAKTCSGVFFWHFESLH